MDFFIIILFMLVPLVFKGIEKGLTKGVQPNLDTPEMEDEAEMQQVKFPFDMQSDKPRKTEVKDDEKPVSEVKVKKNKVLTSSVEANEKKEKIDAKKLIIYSEIMKPKY